MLNLKDKNISMQTNEPYKWDEHFVNAWNKAEQERLLNPQPPKPKQEPTELTTDKVTFIINQKEFKL